MTNSPRDPSLPKELSALTDLAPARVSRRMWRGARTWFVEVEATLLLRVVKRAAAAARDRRRYTLLKAAFNQLRSETEIIRSQNADLNRVNEQLRELLGRHNPRSSARSPQNYFGAAEEHGFVPKGPPLQGGSAGLEKR